MGELWQKVQSRGAELVGMCLRRATYSTNHWPSALFDAEHFLGLGLDEDNKSDMTEVRILNCLLKLLQELGFEICEASWTAC